MECPLKDNTGSSDVLQSMKIEDDFKNTRGVSSAFTDIHEW